MRRPVPPAAPQAPQPAAGAPDDAALLHGFNAELLSRPSATLTLERWCATHAVAPGCSAVVARRAPGVERAAGPEHRRLLAVEPDELVRHRRVRLSCGGRVLSEADNWYVPARLTPAMNRALEGWDAAFGRVVAALEFDRRTLSVRLLRPAVPSAPAGAVLEHRAVLTLPDGTPFSTVVETYTAAVLAAP